MKVLKDLQPEPIMYYFEEISKIPRGSGNEKAISDYCVGIAKSLGLDYYQDQFHNVVIYKPGTLGYENSPPVIIQGHLDMVCEKNEGTIHDFEKDGLKLKVEGDFIKAEGTTLGADNGVAVAYGLALAAAKNIAHPPLEILMTSDEEVGLLGAASIDGNVLHGRKLINLDSGPEGSFLAGCAGGQRAIIKLPIKYEDRKWEKGLKINIKGLKGGHSGMDIILQRGNANKLMGRLLNKLAKKFPYQLAELSGGSKDNAIPRESKAIIYVQEKDYINILSFINTIELIFQKEYKDSDQGLYIEAIDYENFHDKVYCEETKNKAIAIPNLTHCGVYTMNLNMENLVDTSNNLGAIQSTEEFIYYNNAIRSTLDSRKEEMAENIEIIARLVGGGVEIGNGYPGWNFNPESKLLKKCIDVYQNKFGEKPKVEAIHAGLECGLFSDKLPGCDMISFGPDNYDCHTPDERLSIKSFGRTWELLIDILKALQA